MNVILLTSNNTINDMVQNATLAALTCHANTDMDTDPKELLQRIIRLGHESILEHINLTYSIKGLSRACLHELSRHRHISLSVESTRHTLRKYVDDPQTLGYLYRFTPDRFHEVAQDTLFSLTRKGDLPDDELKYYLPEFWPTNLVLTTNVRGLRHILKLRTAPDALMEFRTLGVELFRAVPDEFKYLIDDCVYIGG